jgi:hypothetical protein
VTSAAGGATHALLQHVRWALVLPMAVGVIAGAQLGAWIARRLHGTLVIRLLAIALAAVGVRLLLR